MTDLLTSLHLSWWGVTVATPILIGLVLWVTMKANQIKSARITELTSLASRLHFSFRREETDKVPPELSDLPLLTGRSGLRMECFLEHADTFPGLSAFDCRFYVQSGNSRTLLQQTVACLELQRPGSPEFAFKPESWVDRVAEKLGGQDIDFDSRPAFSRRYRLQGPNESAIRSVFSERVLSQLEQLDECAIESNGQRIIYYAPKHLVGPNDYETFLRRASEVLQLFV